VVLAPLTIVLPIIVIVAWVYKIMPKKTRWAMPDYARLFSIEVESARRSGGKCMVTVAAN
jgi:hypothetical protein